MTEPVLSVRDLRVEFVTRRGVLKAIDGASFDIAKGEVLGVVGESGAGKSVTGSAVIGLIDPPGRIAGGEIRLSGERIDNLSPERRISPPAMRPGGSMSPITAAPVTDLPAPDSPTTPSTSPRPTSKETPSIAFNTPRRVTNSTRRSRTERTGSGIETLVAGRRLISISD